MGGYGREKSFLLFKETEPTPVEDVGYQAWKPARSMRSGLATNAPSASVSYLN